MQQYSASERRTDPLPGELASPQAKLVYLYIEAMESATVDDQTEALSMKKLSVLSVLRSLSGDGLVERDGNRFVVQH